MTARPRHDHRPADLAAEILHKVAVKGIQLDVAADGFALVYRGAADRLSVADLDELRRLAPEVREILGVVRPDEPGQAR